MLVVADRGSVQPLRCWLSSQLRGSYAVDRGSRPPAAPVAASTAREPAALAGCLRSIVYKRGPRGAERHVLLQESAGGKEGGGGRHQPGLASLSSTAPGVPKRLRNIHVIPEGGLQKTQVVDQSTQGTKAGTVVEERLRAIGLRKTAHGQRFTDTHEGRTPIRSLRFSPVM